MGILDVFGAILVKIMTSGRGNVGIYVFFEGSEHRSDNVGIHCVCVDFPGARSAPGKFVLGIPKAPKPNGCSEIRLSHIWPGLNMARGLIRIPSPPKLKKISENLKSRVGWAPSLIKAPGVLIKPLVNGNFLK